MSAADEDEELDGSTPLDEPVTVADLVALLSTLRTALAGLDGMLRSAIRDLVGEAEEDQEESR